MRASIPLILALLSGAVAAPARAGLPPPLAESSHMELDARGLRGLRVENPRGLVRVRESRDGRIRVTAHKICRGRDAQQAQQYARETQVTSVREGDRHVIRVGYPRRTQVEIRWWDLIQGGDFSELSRPRAEVRLAIEAPRSLVLDLVSSSGDIEIEGAFAPLRAATASGDITFHGLDAQLSSSSGDIEVRSGRRVSVRTTSGDCTADSLTAGFSFESSSGDLVLAAALDSARVRTASGDVAIAFAARGLDAETSSGELEVASAGGPIRLVSASGGIRVGAAPRWAGLEARTTSGDLRVQLPRGTQARLEASTSSGGIDCQIPITLEQSDRHRLAGRLGAGGPAVRLSSASGDIQVMTGGR